MQMKKNITILPILLLLIVLVISISYNISLYNSSLKFEIKAKQFYAASQRVL